MIARPKVNEWNLLLYTLPEEGREFSMCYKDIAFVCTRTGNDFFGSSLLGELKLSTNLERIKEHDFGNESYTRWRYT